MTEAGNCRINRMAVFLFDRVEVGHRAAALDGARLADHPGFAQHGFEQAGLAAASMAGQSDVADGFRADGHDATLLLSRPRAGAAGEPRGPAPSLSGHEQVIGILRFRPMCRTGQVARLQHAGTPVPRTGKPQRVPGAHRLVIPAVPLPGPPAHLCVNGSLATGD